MKYLNLILQFWVETHWAIALVMAVTVNICVYMCTAWLLTHLVGFVVQKFKVGEFIDQRPLKNGQIKTEARNGIVACIIFAVCSLASRELFTSLWPESLLDLILQVLCFSIFYETYSYFVHRFLHTKRLVRVHLVHHKSVRVTPWSAYSVHPVEATFIGISAPLFMLLFSFSLGMALVLHIAGMMFTILLHSNFRYTANNIVLKLIFTYPGYHSAHHINGDVNYGFINKGWDSVFKTLQKTSG